MDPSYSSFDISLQVTIAPAAAATDEEAAAAAAEAFVVCRSNFRHLYWTIRQQLVHHTVSLGFWRGARRKFFFLCRC